MRITTIIVLIFCTFFQQSGLAAATSCEDRNLHYLDWVQKYFELADVVFLGKVVYSDVPIRLIPPVTPAPAVPAAPKKTDSVASMKELLELIEAGQRADQQAARSPPPAALFQTATFELVKSWKGPAGTPVFGKSLISNQYNSALFKVGETYLVFGFKNDDEAYLVPPRCTYVLSGQDTPSRIRVLDALTK